MRKIVIIGGILVVLITAASTTLLWTRGQGNGKCEEKGPRGVKVDPSGDVPTEVVSGPPKGQDDCPLIGSTVANSDGSFTSDGRRMSDLAGLQIALAKYLQQYGRYPTTLSAIDSNFLSSSNGKTDLPRDPETGALYPYTPTSDRQSYKLSATLSSGKVFSVDPD